MYSLKNYTEQCYNIGSPSPNPTRSPLKELPTSQIDSEYSFSPENLTRVRKDSLKRKIGDQDSDIESDSESVPKRVKMNKKDKAEFMSLISEQIAKQIKIQYEANNSTLVNTINGALETKLATLENQIKGISDETKSELSIIKEDISKLKDKVTESTEINYEELKNKLVPVVKDDIVSAIKVDLKSESDAVNAVWKATLADKVWEAEHNMIIFNKAIANNPQQDVSEFLEKDMNLDNETRSKLSIRRACRLGKGRNNQPPPLLVSFSHPSERNLVLNHRKI